MSCWRRTALTVAVTTLQAAWACGQAASGGPAHVWEDRPVEDFIFWSTNFDDTRTPESAAALSRYLPPDLGFVARVREGAIGPPSTKENPRPMWNWERLTWLRGIHTQPWMQGRGLLVEPMASTVCEGDPPSGEDWGNNIRWKHNVLSKQFPNRERGIVGWLHTNEPDNFRLPGQGNPFLRDFEDIPKSHRRIS